MCPQENLEETTDRFPPVRPVWAVLALALLLSGCAGGPPAEQPSIPPPSDHAGTVFEPGISTEAREASWTAAVGAGDQSVAFSGSGNPAETVGGAGLTGTIVEMAWTPSSLLSEEMQLVVSRDGSVLASASGPSPLRIVMEGDAAAGDLVFEGAPAAPGGAYVDQEYIVYLTTFKG